MDVMLPGPGTIIKVARAIKTAADKVRQNKEECREIGRRAAMVSDLMSELHKRNPEIARDQPAERVLTELQWTLDTTLELVRSFDKSNAVRRFFMGAKEAKKLRKAQDDIIFYTLSGLLASLVHSHGRAAEQIRRRAGEMDAMLPGAGEIINLARAIKTAADNVKQNKEECREIGRRAAMVSDLVSELHKKNPEIARDQPAERVLTELQVTLDTTLELVRSFDKSNAVRRFFTGAKEAKKLRQAKDDMSFWILTGMFASHVHNC